MTQRPREGQAGAGGWEGLAEEKAVTVAGSDEIFHRLTTLVKKRDLPVVVSMGSIAASFGGG